jgi:hypothetical protein
MGGLGKFLKAAVSFVLATFIAIIVISFAAVCWIFSTVLGIVITVISVIGLFALGIYSALFDQEKDKGS